MVGRCGNVHDMLNDYIHQLYDFYPQGTTVMLSDFSHLYADSAPCCHPSLRVGDALSLGTPLRVSPPRQEWSRKGFESILQHVAKKRKTRIRFNMFFGCFWMFLLDQILFP